MALTGHLSDLSLSELIEFFCNQRKTGTLKVLYDQGPGHFYLHSGAVVDAKIGVLQGIEAVYYALTLPSAAFEFKGASECVERTINQPWTQVVLEGLRRLDEGIVPAEAFPDDAPAAGDDAAVTSDQHQASSQIRRAARVPAFLSAMPGDSRGKRKPLIAGAVILAVLASVAAIGVPAGWYRKSKHGPVASQTSDAPVFASGNSANATAETEQPNSTESDSPKSDAAALAAKRQREKERRAREVRANASAAEPPKPAAVSSPQSASNDTAKAGPKKVTVQVSYDESGRVVQASGGDPTALRIARQKRFPPGKAGTATITIPIN
jgi:Domain of unknown function (DUF4388)